MSAMHGGKLQVLLSHTDPLCAVCMNEDKTSYQYHFWDKCLATMLIFSLWAHIIDHQLFSGLQEPLRVDCTKRSVNHLLS